MAGKENWPDRRRASMALRQLNAVAYLMTTAGMIDLSFALKYRAFEQKASPTAIAQTLLRQITNFSAVVSLLPIT